MADRKSIDEQFSDSYRTDPRTLQPSTGGVRDVRVERETGYDPKRRRGGVTARAASYLGEGLQAQGAIMQQTGKSDEAKGIRSVVVEKYQAAGTSLARTGRSLELAGKRVQGRKKVSAAGVASRSAQRSVTLGIWSWAFFVWGAFMVPFTILSIVFMALTEAIYQFLKPLNPTVEDRTIVEDGFSTVLNLTTWFINKVIEAFGIDLEILNPANFFMITHVLVVLTGWGVLLAIALIYTISGQRAFSGRGASGKNAMFLLAFVAYTIPILNLFPWFFLWTLMVLKNPR